MLRRLIHVSLFFLSIFALGGQAAAQTTTITTDSVIQLSTCAGGAVLVPFTVTNPNFQGGNVFYAELSNLLGSFNAPDTIGSIPFIFGTFGIIFAQLPDDASFGPFYKVRVRSSDPGIVGTPSPNTIIITSFPSLGNITMSPTTPVCEGTPVTLTAGAGFGFEASYSWSNGDTTRIISVTEPGTYSVTATALACDNSGPSVDVVMLPRPQEPTLSIQPNSDLSTNLSSGTFNWYLDGNLVAGNNGPSMTPTATGWYSVAQSGNNGCFSAASEQVYHVQVDGEVQGSEFLPPRPYPYQNLAVRVYPVPTSDILHIETYLLEEEKMFFLLYDSQGKVATFSEKDIVTGPYIRAIDMSAYPAGVYSLHLFVHGNLRTYRVMKG
jgi:hypothetical protein